MSITQVLRISVPVSHQDKAKSFYLDAMGLDLLGDNRPCLGREGVTSRGCFVEQRLIGQ